jgi:hypothetical protein
LVGGIIGEHAAQNKDKSPVRGPIAVIIGVSASAPAVLTGSACLVEPIFKREHVISHETWRRRRR